MRLKMTIVPLILVALLQGCTWVKLSAEAEDIQIITAEKAEGCKLLGHTTSMVKWTVASFARNEEKVKNELETLARNNALELEGNAIMPVSEIEEGKQKFAVYRCE